MSGEPRAVFFGSPQFAVPLLDASQQVVDIVLVVTQPPRVRGRARIASPTPVQLAAAERGMTVITPDTLSAEVLETIGTHRAAIGILGAYGKILPQALLSLFPQGIVNVHPSLLPRHRGASPIAGALLAGDTTTGVTLIRLDEKMDHGPIIAQEMITIEPHEHRPHLETRLATIGGTMLREWLPPYLAGSAPLREQDHGNATVTTMMKKQSGTIDWRNSAVAIERQVQAYDPWPGTTTAFEGTPLRILDAHAVARNTRQARPVGTVVRTGDGIVVICGVGALALLRVQTAGKKPMDADAFTRGHSTFVETKLG